MEEAHTPIDTPEDRSAKTAETLRTLREQADQTLQSHLRRIEQTEAELSRRINSLTEELGRDEVASKAQVASLLEQLNDRGDALQRTEEELANLQQELESLQQERNSLSEELEEVLTERLKETEEKAQLQADLERLEQLAEQHGEERNLLASELQQLGTELEASSTECQQLAERLEESQELRDETGRECERLNAQIEKLTQQQQQLELERQDLNAQLDQHRGQLTELEQARDQLAADFQSTQNYSGQLTSERDELTRQLEETRGASDNVQAELAALQIKHSDTQASLGQIQGELEQSRSAWEESQQLVEDLQQNLSAAQDEHQQRLEQVQQQIDESERKCELALADVHKLKKVNAELHEELDSRPEKDDGESHELVHLRSERDQLAARVEELEQIPATDSDGDSQQKLADLQARFEMAVEDVRSLKQENASLKDQLTSGSGTVTPSGGDGELDWQAQKARLMQELAAEDGAAVTPEREEQRATIEGTITITDKVVGEKDREIAELRSQLAEAGGSTFSEEEIEKIRAEAVREAQEHILQEDEVIQAERTRLEQLQEEWKEKLRKAELEISVQRAEIAREKAKLEEQMSFLESQKEDSGSSQKPRRRWLSALGIKDDEEPSDG